MIEMVEDVNSLSNEMRNRSREVAECLKPKEKKSLKFRYDDF